MTQREAARQGMITKEMETAARDEGVPAEYIRQGVAEGTIVIPANIYHKSLHPYAIGKGLRTKMNVNLGISEDVCNYETEQVKAKSKPLGSTPSATTSWAIPRTRLADVPFSDS